MAAVGLQRLGQVAQEQHAVGIEVEGFAELQDEDLQVRIGRGAAQVFVEGLGRAEVQAAFDVEDRDARRCLALRAFAQFAGLREVILDDFGRGGLAEVERHRHRRAEEDRDVEGREERRREGREEDRAVLRAGF